MAVDKQIGPLLAISMIRIELNGQKKSLEDSITIEKLIHLLQLKNPNIAVALNFDVIPRSEYPAQRVTDGDKVEILHPVGGG